LYLFVFLCGFASLRDQVRLWVYADFAINMRQRKPFTRKLDGITLPNTWSGK